MARTDPTIYMRLPAELKAQLEREAFANRRSIAAEVTLRLARTFEDDRLAEESKPDASKWDEATRDLYEANSVVVRLSEAESGQLSALVEAVVAAGNMQRKLEKLISQLKPSLPPGPTKEGKTPAPKKLAEAASTDDGAIDTKQQRRVLTKKDK